MNPLNKQFTSTMIRAIMLIHATLSTFPNIMYTFHHNNKIHDYDYDMIMIMIIIISAVVMAHIWLDKQSYKSCGMVLVQVIFVDKKLTCLH